MPWFGSKKTKDTVKTYTGRLGDLSPEQEECFEGLKKIIQEENLTQDPRFDDFYLLRFCRARDFDLQKVCTMFKNFIQWRKDNNVDNAIVAFKCPNIPDVKKIYKCGYHGTDREGRPFYIDQPCQFEIDDVFKFTTKEEIIQYYIKEYEWLLHVRLPACSKAVGNRIETTFSIINIQGFSMGMFKEKSREFLKLPIGITQNNYPEVMHKLLIINAPFLFKGAWAVIKPFLAAGTRSKISILGNKYHKELFEHVDPENVPESLGGSCTCHELGGDCFSSDKGPWQEYPGDEFGEAAKKQLREEEKFEDNSPFVIDTEGKAAAYSSKTTKPIFGVSD